MKVIIERLGHLGDGVAHSEFLELDLSQLQKEKSVVYDVKGVLGEYVDGRL